MRIRLNSKIRSRPSQNAYKKPPLPLSLGFEARSSYFRVRLSETPSPSKGKKKSPTVTWLERALRENGLANDPFARRFMAAIGEEFMERFSQFPMIHDDWGNLSTSPKRVREGNLEFSPRLKELVDRKRNLFDNVFFLDGDGVFTNTWVLARDLYDWMQLQISPRKARSTNAIALWIAGKSALSRGLNIVRLARLLGPTKQRNTYPKFNCLPITQLEGFSEDEILANIRAYLKATILNPKFNRHPKTKEFFSSIFPEAILELSRGYRNKTLFVIISGSPALLYEEFFKMLPEYVETILKPGLNEKNELTLSKAEERLKQKLNDEESLEKLLAELKDLKVICLGADPEMKSGKELKMDKAEDQDRMFATGKPHRPIPVGIGKLALALELLRLLKERILEILKKRKNPDAPIPTPSVKMLKAVNPRNVRVGSDCITDWPLGLLGRKGMRFWINPSPIIKAWISTMRSQDFIELRHFDDHNERFNWLWDLYRSFSKALHAHHKRIVVEESKKYLEKRKTGF